MYKFDKRVTSRLLKSSETFATTLMTIAIAAYGDDAFEMDSAVLFTTLEEDFRCKLSEENENRLNAIRTAMTTDLFYRSVATFDAITLAICDGDIGGIPDGEPEEINGPEALWAIYEVGLLNDDNMTDSKKLFTDAVNRHIESILREEALDLEEIADDVDTLEEAARAPYYQQYVQAKVRALSEQLLELGCPPQPIQKLLADNMLDITV